MVDFTELQKVALFRGMARDDIRLFLTFGKTRQVDKGEVIFREGEPGDALFLVLEGKVEVRKRLPIPPGAENVVSERSCAVLFAGDVFGEMSLLDGSPRSATILAPAPALVFELSGSDFRRIADEFATLAIGLLRNLAGVLASRLRTVNKELSDLYQNLLRAGY